MTDNERNALRKEMDYIKLHLDHLDDLCHQCTNLIYNLEEKLFDYEDDLSSKFFKGVRS